MDENQGTTTNYFDSWDISDEDKGYLQSTNYKTASDLVKGLRETKSYLGMDKNTLIRLPNADENGNVDYTEVFKQLGRPDDAAGYGFEENDFTKAIAPKMLELGITKKQAQELSAALNEYDTQYKAALENERITKKNNEMAELKREEGSAFAESEAMVGAAVRYMNEKFGIGAEELNAMEEHFGSKKAFQLYKMIGQSLNEGKVLKDYSSAGETPEQAKFKLSQMRKDPEYVAKLAKRDPKTIEETNRLVALTMSVK